MRMGVHAVKLLIVWKVDAARKVVQCQDGKSYFVPAELGISVDPEIRLIFQFCRKNIYLLKYSLPEYLVEE